MLQFNPLDRHYNNIVFFCSDLDRNNYFYSESFNCDYGIDDEFSESLVENVGNLNYLSFLHPNIRSLPRNFDSGIAYIRNSLLANVQLKSSCIGVSQNSFYNL